MLTKSEFVKHILKGHTPAVKEKATAFAPANIALVKYWGKRDSQLNLPVTDSLSIDLGNLGTETTIEHSPDGHDAVILNGNKLGQDDAFAIKVINFVDLFRETLNQAATNQSALTITTNNNIPTGAGVASSASGFAALTKALDQFFGLGLSGRELSLLANLGSGSASRSIFKGFVYRHAGVDPEGMDSYSEPLPFTPFINAFGGIIPRRISRRIPPPVAVTAPRIITPSKSIFFWIPVKVPEREKAMVPISSRIKTRLLIIIPCNKLSYWPADKFFRRQS